MRQFQKSETSPLTSPATHGYPLTIGPQGAGHNKRKEAHSGRSRSSSNRNRHSWSRCVHRTMNRSPGLVTPGNSHPVGTRGPNGSVNPWDTRSGGNPSEPRQVRMTLSATSPLCVVPIDGNRVLLEQQNPRSTGTACNGRQRRSGCLIRIADDCRGWFDI